MVYTLYREIASAYAHMIGAENVNNVYWHQRASDRLQRAIDELPSGSGIDSGFELDLLKTNKDKIVISFGFHHMNQDGYYTEWSHHTMVITPDWSGCDIRITGKNRNNIKDYLYEILGYALNDEYMSKTV